MTRPIIFSQLSDPHHPGYLRMRASCERHGWPVDAQVRGFSEAGIWEHFFASLAGYREQGYTHAFRLDAFDVLALGPPAELDAALEHYGRPALLMAAEGGCWPDSYRISDYPERKHLFWYAHSPIVVDLTQDLEPLTSKFSHRLYGDDQRWLADLILDAVPGAVIDRDCRVVQSIAFALPWQDHFDLEGGRIRNKVTRSLPLFSHANGRTDDSWLHQLVTQ